MLVAFANPRMATTALARIPNLSRNAIKLHRSKSVGSTAPSR
jgi:hypothetical protein